MIPDPIDGIEWCAAHDDFAIEGYDWSDICRTGYWGDAGSSPCDLRPVYRQPTSALAEVAAWICDIGYPIDWQTDAPPPAVIRQLIEQAWVVADELVGDDAAACRAIIAEEGGWA